MRLTPSIRSGGVTGGWARSVEILVDGYQPVDLCFGFRKAGIRDAFDALTGCARDSRAATGNVKRGAET
jgi:hypothetical protein